MQYRRSQISGGTYFFTLVTHNRQKVFLRAGNVSLLREAFRQVKEKHPFTIDAIVILPDHLHCLLTLPRDDADYPQRIRMIKGHFTRKYKGGLQAGSASRAAKAEKAVWQRRYWEHLIRNEDDYARHVEYIHYNPVKHGLAVSPKDWPWSSFRVFVKKGVCGVDWGAGEVITFDEGVGSE
jgi:REP-associated tyrosine transposase